MLTHRLNEPLQPRQHLRLGVEKPLRAVAREKLLQRICFAGGVFLNHVELAGARAHVGSEVGYGSRVIRDLI